MRRLMDEGGVMIKAMKDFQIPMRVEVDKDTAFPNVRQIHDGGL